MNKGDKVQYKRQYLEDAGFELGSALYYLKGTVIDLKTIGKTKCAVVNWDGHSLAVNIDILEKAKDQTGTGQGSVGDLTYTPQYRTINQFGDTELFA